MTPDQFRNALARLALHPDEAATFLGVHRSQIFRRLNGSVAVPASEAMLLQLMLAMRWNVRDVVRRIKRSGLD